MPEETKSNPPTPPESDKKPAAGTPTQSAQSPSPKENPSVTAVPKTPPPTAGAKPAEGHTAPPKPTGPATTPWDSPMVQELKRQFGSGLTPLTYLNQNYMEADRTLIPEILQVLRDQHEFDYCVDLTAAHYPDRSQQFDVVWILYSFARNERIRVKTRIADGETLPTSVNIWPTANWLEREVFDMFGITFNGHPDMKRILLPDGWKGYPLRKDYGIIQQDDEWVQINLGIKSGQ
jgi:NADH-quinone oxidoreductase subunit C